MVRGPDLQNIQSPLELAPVPLARSEALFCALELRLDSRAMFSRMNVKLPISFGAGLRNWKHHQYRSCPIQQQSGHVVAISNDRLGSADTPSALRDAPEDRISLRG